MRLGYAASPRVAEVIASLERVEDVKFSPSNRRLALVASDSNRLAVVDISIAAASGGPAIALTEVADISGPCLAYPHGVDFIGEDIIVVASRFGDVAILELPPGGKASQSYELQPLAVLRSGDGHPLHSPGSVAITEKGNGFYEAIICNVYGHYVSRHVLDASQSCSITSDETLLRKGLEIPDGICISRDRQWIALSNHALQTIHLYRNDSSLDESSLPSGILRGAFWPHGLRFTPDGQFLLAADAGAPYVHIYAADGSDWRGVRSPVASYRVLNDEQFWSRRANPEEGGPKGIDIDSDMKILAVTSECRPLAFFDLAAILERLRNHAQLSQHEDFCPDQNGLELSYELSLRDNASRRGARAREAEMRASQAEDRANQAELRAHQANLQATALLNSTSWRTTAPFRRVSSWLRRVAGY